ncbi:caspase family protein [Leptospira andrefontaineae]|uniref:Caspase family protein n=1 Tax=Leptospira andrefontaineae TaxID=2484976 RepID=A0A4R9GYU3_9LEPT|nr:caspase family protein [Leptospira andrefontaineae]TGK36495.1 caspase family protein [Leptospira andrefontaineae]
MRIAIVIGISNYKSIQPLPACAKDRDSIVNFLNATKKYDSILVLKGDGKSCHEDKQELVTFLKNHQGNKVEELLFYFSGHGDFDGTEFYYIWSDFDRDKKRQTSLQNEEVDTLLKNLNPEITFKIIDACHSGISYVKDADSISAYIKSNKNGFNKCYFLFSSQADQSSYASEEFSFFTKAFISSFRLNSGDIIRYKDIIDSISDEFDNRSYQKPYFVIQADFTEVYCEITENLISTLGKADSGKKDEDSSVDHRDKLKEAIQKEAERYITKEDAIIKVNSLNESSELINEGHEIWSYYTKALSFNKNYDGLPLFDQLLLWLQKNEKELFIEIKTVERIIKVPYPELSDDVKGKTNASRQSVKSQLHVARRIPNFPIKLISTVEFEFNSIVIQLLPKYPNLPKEEIYLIPLISKTQMKVFYARATYIEQSWGEYKIVLDNFKWNYIAFDLKPFEPVNQIKDKIIGPISIEILEDLRRKFLGLNTDSTITE